MFLLELKPKNMHVACGTCSQQYLSFSGKGTNFIHRDVHGRRPSFALDFLHYLQRSFLSFLNVPQDPFSHPLTIERGAPSC